jgi:hypothetical protein
VLPRASCVTTPAWSSCSQDWHLTPRLPRIPTPTLVSFSAAIVSKHSLVTVFWRYRIPGSRQVSLHRSQTLHFHAAAPLPTAVLDRAPMVKARTWAPESASGDGEEQKSIVQRSAKEKRSLAGSSKLGAARRLMRPVSSGKVAAADGSPGGSMDSAAESTSTASPKAGSPSKAGSPPMGGADDTAGDSLNASVVRRRAFPLPKGPKPAPPAPKRTPTMASPETAAEPATAPAPLQDSGPSLLTPLHVVEVERLSMTSSPVFGSHEDDHHAAAAAGGNGPSAGSPAPLPVSASPVVASPSAPAAPAPRAPEGMVPLGVIDVQRFLEGVTISVSTTLSTRPSAMFTQLTKLRKKAKARRDGRRRRADSDASSEDDD